MALVRWHGKEWDPFKELMEMQKSTDDLFNASWLNLPDRLSKEAVWKPSMDVVEGKDEITIKADLPGVKESDIDVSVTDDILTINGEKKQEHEIKDKTVHRLERFYGSFTRSISLPAYVDTSKISAKFKDGTLELTVPKTEKAKPRQIKVEVK